MSFKTLCVIPFFKDTRYFYSLVDRLRGHSFPKHLLILIPREFQDEKSNIEREMSGFEYSLMLTDYIDASHRCKIGLTIAKEWKVEYTAIFNEGCDDDYENFLNFIGSTDKVNYSLISSSRIPKDLSIGRAFFSLSTFFSSVVGMKFIKDVSGDSCYLLRTQDFSNDYQDLSYLPDNQFIFFHLILFSFYRRFNIRFLDRVPLVRKSFYRYNTASFFHVFTSLLSYLFVRSSSLSRRTQISNVIPEDFIVHAKINDRQRVEKNHQTPVVTSKADSEEKKFTPSQFINLDQAVNKKSDASSLVHVHEKHKDQLIVNWCLTNICNYKCTYCPDELHNGTSRGVELEVAKKFVERVVAEYPDKKVHFELTGGEVTYYKGFKELIRHIKSLGHYVAIISNGARKIEFWEENLEFLDHIMFSFHSEQGDPEHFQKVIKYTSRKTSVHVNIMMKPENFDLCHELAQSIINESPVTIALQPLLEGMDGKMFDYTSDQMKVLNSQSLNRSVDVEPFKGDRYHSRGELILNFKGGEKLRTNSAELISNNFNHWSGWDCNIGLETICVDFYGKLLRGWCGVGGVFGNINDFKIRFPKKPILCNKEQCSCGQDIMTTKIKKL